MSLGKCRDVQREAALDAARSLITRAPFAALTREAVCQESGLKYSTVRSYFPDGDVMIRLAAARLFADINARLKARPAGPSPSVHAAVTAYVGEIARLIASDEYRCLLKLLIRESDVHAWLLQLYEEQVRGTFEAELARRVRAAGDRYGTHVALRSGAARAALQRLEGSLAVPRLLPAQSGPAAEDVVPAVVQDLLAATHAWDVPAATAA